MSTQELNFYHPQCDSALEVKKVDDRIMLNLKQGMEVDVEFPLNRNQAHMLYLYLQEHLGFNEPPKIPNSWL